MPFLASEVLPEMMNSLLEQLSHNAFFSGGLSLMLIGSAVAFLRKLPGQILGFLDRRLSITVEIQDLDPAFRWLQVWLAKQPYARRARDLSLATTWVRAEAGSASGMGESAEPEDGAIVFDPDEAGPSETACRVKFLLSPAPGTHVMLYRGRLLILYRYRRELQNIGNGKSFQETLTIKLFGGTRALIEQLLDETRELASPRSPGVSILTSRYDGWEPTSWQPKRPLESLVLADGVLEDILADLRAFSRSRSWYVERGVPYRRGYLLHGPPGNGKTTLVLAAAASQNLSVCVLNLSTRGLNDDGLRSMVDSVPPATLVLIEDVDCVFKSERSTNEQTGVTLSGLLNALDGVSSREGRILFLTTNHPERLDPALIRPGRIDRRIELANATPEQARRLFLWFYRGCGLGDQELPRLADRFAARIPEGKVCMAAVQEHLLRHRAAPEAAAHEGAFEIQADAAESPSTSAEEPASTLSSSTSTQPAKTLNAA